LSNKNAWEIKEKGRQEGEVGEERRQI
jgi:hypothetical protein